jgi:mRNA-degrading endonuclease toxin of MazEF toxin-antitoxin module
VPSLATGRIVRATLPDPQGQNPKNRRFVVVSSPQQIAGGGPIRVVMVTSSRIRPDSEYVDLQYGPNCLTTFDVPSAALCSHEYTVATTSVEVTKGFVRPEYVERIENCMTGLGSQLTKSYHP